ncbi:MAG TPA: hypothetical protein VM557_08110 [Thermoanaerobaculia bacterium]|nr:hypothetical protein [Thermoanaerobaculia bacterium]
MRMTMLVSASVVAIALGASMGSVFAAGESKAAPTTSAKSVAATDQFATLKGVKAVPMASSELDAVKGMHVHFLDAGGGKIHLAGDVKTKNNWTNIGGTDGLPVAPSYKGLCVAHASGGIFIPTVGGITTQCP